MTVVMGASWLALLAAVWQADGLEAWSLKLAAVLFGVLAATGLVSRIGGKSGAARVEVISGSPRPRKLAQARTIPPKNLKKKPDRIVRRYRPVSFMAPLRPASRRLTLVKGVAAIRPTLASVTETRPAQPAKLRRSLI